MSSSGESENPAEASVTAPTPLRVNTPRVIEVGLGFWVLALIAVLAVPSLRTPERDWWVWVPVAGLALGALGWLYVRRGRGNATEA